MFRLLVAKPNTVDSCRSLGGTSGRPVAAPLTTRVRTRAKEPEAQPPPATAVDIYRTHRRVSLANARRKVPPQTNGTVVLSGTIPEAIREDSDTEELSITFSPPRQPMVMFPQPKPKTPPTWTERHRKRIEGRKEPLAEPFANSQQGGSV